MDHLDTSKLVVFDFIEDVVVDVYGRVLKAIKEHETVVLGAYIRKDDIPPDYICINLEGFCVVVNAEYSDNCDTESRILFYFEYSDGDLSKSISHYQKFHDVGDRLPMLPSELDEVAKWIVKKASKMSIQYDD